MNVNNSRVAFTCCFAFLPSENKQFNTTCSNCTSRVTRHASVVTRHTSHITRHTSHITRHTSHITRHTSVVTCNESSRHYRHVLLLIQIHGLKQLVLGNLNGGHIK